MDFGWDAPLHGDVAFALVAEVRLPEALDGWEQARVQFILQNDDLLTIGDPSGDRLVEQLTKVGLVRVVRGLTRVLCLRWVGGLSPEDGQAVWLVLRQLRKWDPSGPVQDYWIHGLAARGVI
jgi:hypothetical protein